MRPAAFRFAWGVAAVLAGPSLVAKERLVRQLGGDLPRPPQYVRKLAQDPTGYLWIGTDGGLLRYDGVELRRWAPEVIDRPVRDIAIGEDGTVYVAGHRERIHRITATGAEPLAGQNGAPWRHARRIGVDGRGRLWVITFEDRLFRLAEGETWTEPLRAALDEERPVLVERDGDGVLVATNLGLWRVNADDRTQRLASYDFPSFGLRPEERPVDLLRMPDGSLTLLTFGSSIFTYRDGRLTLRGRAAGNGWGLALRGETAWVAGTEGIAAVRPDGTLEMLTQERPGGQGANAILVDREGSLWVGGPRGAFQFPEPETVAWSKEDGLGGPNLKLARTSEGVWISYWAWRLGVIERTPEGPRARKLADPRGNLSLCVSGGGTLWGSGWPGRVPDHSIMSRRDGVFRFHRHMRNPFECSTAPDGGVWLSTGDGLFYASPTDTLSELGPVHDGARAFMGHDPYEDARGVLWAANVEDGRDVALCRAPAVEVRAGRRPPWTCLPLPGVRQDVVAIVATPSGAIWVATEVAGIFRFDGTTLERLPGSSDLPSAKVSVLEPARAGGFWISGSEYLWRIKERTDLPAGWSIEERLGSANGIMALGCGDLVEDDDGTLWMTTAAGVVQVPPSARSPLPMEARVRLQRVAVNGHLVDPSAPVRAPYGANEVALDLTALLFRDPSSIRYRIRLGPEAPWSTPSRSSRIQLMDVPSGSYQVEVSATTDEVSWTLPAAVLDFRVPRPWHRQPAVWALAGLAVLGAAVSVQRAALAVRLKLERQRTQIALDLHDEMGSGLGSIRVLASMAARGAVDTEKLRQAAARIERTARDLGQAMSGIVWSLREGRRTLRDLCAHVAERGHELFPAESPAFDTSFPTEWPDEALPLPARRNLQLILMEALHNAAKHAQASQVVLGAAQEEGRWRLWVEDDGAGIKGRPAGHVGGHGLPGMAERARSIEASLVIGRARASVSGTRVEVILPPPRFPSWRLTRRGLEEAKEAWRTSRS